MAQANDEAANELEDGIREVFSSNQFDSADDFMEACGFGAEWTKALDLGLTVQYDVIWHSLSRVQFKHHLCDPR